MRRLVGTTIAALLLFGTGAMTPVSLEAQQGSVTGRVVDGTTGLPLAGATVRVIAANRSALTNQSGRFALVGMPTGSQELSVDYIGYATATQMVTIGTGVTENITFRMVPEAVVLEGLTATSARQGQAAALNQQLTSLSISNVVAADQIGRFPDANIGDAIKRIPGITVIQDQGEARFGLIRGTEPKYNSVMINGERVPSAEAEVREVQLDLIPSDMVRAVEVSKTLTPDMDADAIGGAVNIVTRSAPAEQRISATLGSGYNFLSDEPTAVGSFVYGNRFGSDGNVGLVVSGSYNNHRLGSDNIEGEWDEDGGDAYLAEFQVRRYDVQRIRRSVSAALDFKLGESSTIILRSMYNHRDDWENRFRTVFKFDGPGVTEAEVERQSKGGIGNDRVDFRRLEDQRTQTHSISGEHLFDGAFLDWSVQMARASEERPNERYIEFVQEDLMLAADISDPSRPQMPTDASVTNASAFELNEITEEFQNTSDEDLSARINLTLPLNEGRSEFKFGARLRDKDKQRNNDFYEYEPTAGFSSLADVDFFDATRNGFLPGSEYTSGPMTTADFLGNLDFANGFDRERKLDEFAAANYDASERILAGYLMLTQQFGNSTTMVAGLRVENTDISYNGNSFNEDTETVVPTTGTKSYTDLFPSVQIRHEISPSQVFRAAWTNTLARPGYYQLVPYRVLVPEDSEAAIGNPDLNPTRAMNLDVMYEQYFQSVGVISAGIFYKDITDFIFEFTQQNFAVDGVTYDEVSQPLNGGSASLLGAEFAFQRTLDEILPGLGIYANYTFNSSSVENIGIDGREGDDLELPGTSKHTLNASLSYDQGRVSFRGSVNYQDDFIDPGEIGKSAFFDRYYDSQTSVDLNGSVVLSEAARFFFEVNNLTNQPLRYYQGTSSRLMQEEFYNTRISTGISIDLR
ncbi:MAG: TonB-dependent receptor [Longimicrobiales bacterium]|nr:TonB-dependent receptor [Longimicrobiales bacterium]